MDTLAVDFKVYRVLYWDGETMKDWFVPANSPADAREQFRMIIDDPSKIIRVKEYMK